MSHHPNSHSLKSEIKDTLTLGFPLIASQLVYASSGFVGTAMVARLGEDALAASVLVGMLWASLSTLFFGILNAISVLVSHQYGANNNKSISHIMSQSYLLGIIIGFIIGLLLYVTPFFLQFTSQPPTVLKLANEYLYALLWTTPGLVLLIIYEQFLAGIHQTKFVLRISLLVVPIEIPIIYILIFGKFGLPACGIAGIGYGFAITYTGTAIVLTYHFLKAKQFQKFAIFSKIKNVNFNWFNELLKLGLPIGLMNVIEVSTFMLATFWMAKFGTTMLAAHQIALQYLMIAIVIIFAMAQAVTIRVGFALGREDSSGIRSAINIGMLLSLILIIFIALGFMLFPNLFLLFDLDIYDPNNNLLIKDSAAFLFICAVLMLFDNFRIIQFGALRGLKDTKFPMLASFIAFWVIGLSSAYLLGFVFNFGGKGIWWGLTLGIASGAVILFLRLQWMLQKNQY